MLLFAHDFLKLAGVQSVVDPLDGVEGEPADHRDANNFDDEHPRDVAGLEVLRQQRNAKDVHKQRHDARADHFPIQAYHRRVNVQQLRHNQS